MEKTAMMISRGDRSAKIELLGEQQFLRDLPQLLETNSGDWVAYHATERIGFAPTKYDAYQMCFRKNIPEEEFVVHCVEPINDEFEFGLG
jgi:hypothetical protein